MILVVATVRVNNGQEAAYEAAVSEIMPKVRAANPGILFYHAGRSRDDGSTYFVVEAYADQTAMDAHVASQPLQQALGGLKPMIADLDIRISDTIA